MLGACDDADTACDLLLLYIVRINFGPGNFILSESCSVCVDIQRLTDCRQLLPWDFAQTTQYPRNPSGLGGQLNRHNVSRPPRPCLLAFEQCHQGPSRSHINSQHKTASESFTRPPERWLRLIRCPRRKDTSPAASPPGYPGRQRSSSRTGARDAEKRCLETTMAGTEILAK